MKKIFGLVSAKRLVTSVLLTFFLLSITHNLFHNSYDHAHDSSCSVYVLEEFFTATDPIYMLEDLALGNVIVNEDLSNKLFSLQTYKHYRVRAPPATFFLS